MTVPFGTPFALLTPAPPIFDGPLPLPLSGGGQALRGQSSATFGTRKDFCGVRTVGGEEMPDIAVGGLQAEPVGEGDYASPAIAAHHSAGAIGIEEFHTEIR